MVNIKTPRQRASVTVRIGQHFELLSYETSSDSPYPSASKHEVHCLSCVQISYTTDMYFNCTHIKSCLDFITKHHVTTGGGDVSRCLGRDTSDHRSWCLWAVGAVALQPLHCCLSSVGLPGPKRRAHTSLTLVSLCHFPLTVIVGML